MKIINQIRSYEQNFTQSKLYIPTVEKDVWVLEDVGRPEGIKIPKVTCIPEGVYDVTITRSTRFKKDMMLLSNQLDMSVERFGVRFTGVRPHGGNQVDNTEGCPLCNFNTDHNGKQWGRASDMIFELVKQWIASGEEVKWIISSN